MRKLVATLALLALSACAGVQLERAVEVGLSKLDAVAGPAAEQAKVACDAEHRVLVDLGDEAKLHASEGRCAKVGDAFDRFGALQRAAHGALERGDVAMAERLVRQASAVTGELLALAAELRKRE